MAFTIGCDVGSQSIKAVLLDEQGQVLATATHPYRMIHKESGWAEQNPQDYVLGLGAVVRKAVADAGIDGRGVTHIGLASQVDGVVPLDSNLKPLRNAIIWLDRRAVAQAESLRERLGDEAAFAQTGLNIDATHTGPKIMWLKEHEPDLYRDARYMPSVGSYLLAWLTGAVVQDHANASSTLLYGITDRDYSDDLLELAGVDRALLPRVLDADEIAGELTPEACETLGLARGCLAVVGTGDEHGACFGAGAVDSRVLVDIAGTAEPVGVATSEPVFDSTRLVETHGYAVRGMYLVENPGFVSGGNTLWLASNILKTSQGELFELAETSVPGAHGLTFIPALSGAMAPRWNDVLRGAFYGLGMHHTQADLARAVVEGNCFAFVDIANRLKEMGLGGDTRIVGGGRRCNFARATKATLTGMSIRRVATEETTAVGAAMLAALAAGFFTSAVECAAAAVAIAPEVQDPVPSMLEPLTDAYGRYRQLFDVLEGSFGVANV